MRVEDLDEGRVRPGIQEAQLADLAWLGLDWDEGPDVGGPFAPYVQTARADLFQSALDRLRDRGLIYECFCSRREVAAAASAPHGPQDEGPAYTGRCLALGTAQREALRASRGAPALRFHVPDGVVRFHDAIHGALEFSPAVETGDFVVRRRDGAPAYQLAVVVDDAAMRISDVVRGADLLSSTARQLLLYEALGFTPPRWIHVPLVLGPDGERLAKRHGAVSLPEVRASGTTPEEVVGRLAASVGLLPPGAKARPAELIELVRERGGVERLEYRAGR